MATLDSNTAPTNRPTVTNSTFRLLARTPSSMAILLRVGGSVRSSEPSVSVTSMPASSSF